MAKNPPNKKVSAASGAKRPAAQSNKPVAKSTGRPAELFTWLAVGLVVVVVAALVIIKVSTGSSATGNSSFQATDATTVAELTTIPASIFNTVGVTSPVAPVTAPQILKGQPALTGTSSTGAKLPEIFYLGAEYCPFCAAQRWATIIALSRFGTWSGLGNMASSTYSGEYAPGTPTFTFVKAKYKSKYLVFVAVEQYNNVFNTALNFYSPLQQPSPMEKANFKKYDTSKYIKGYTAQQNYSIPYLTFANKFLVGGASFSPLTLANISRSQIAKGLSDPTSPVTDAIIASANYQTAAFCTLTNNLPANVCTSSAVKAAKRAMGIK